MVGTEASVGMIQDLISKKRVTGSEAEMWLLSLSFVHHPTKEMVAAATVRHMLTQNHLINTLYSYIKTTLKLMIIICFSIAIFYYDF